MYLYNETKKGRLHIYYHIFIIARGRDQYRGEKFKNFFISDKKIWKIFLNQILSKNITDKNINNLNEKNINDRQIKLH
jgi:hypothetical protein